MSIKFWLQNSRMLWRLLGVYHTLLSCIFLAIRREQFPRSILVANVTRMSLTCYEEIGHTGIESVHEDVTRMLRGNCYR